MANDTQRLADARLLFLDQVTDSLVQGVHRTFIGLWREASKKRNAYVLFQHKLRDIQTWNSVLIEDHASRAQRSHPHLAKAIEALVISWVRVLSSIRLDQGRSVSIKLPTVAVFLHNTYIEVARTLYSDPVAVTTLDAAGWADITRGAVEAAASAAIPYTDLISAYLEAPATEEPAPSEASSEAEPEPVPEPQPEPKEKSVLTDSDDDDDFLGFKKDENGSGERAISLSTAPLPPPVAPVPEPQSFDMHHQNPYTHQPPAPQHTMPQVTPTPQPLFAHPPAQQPQTRSPPPHQSLFPGGLA